jgi:hypothetical protein
MCVCVCVCVCVCARARAYESVRAVVCVVEQALSASQGSGSAGRPSAALAVDTNCDETEPQQGLHTPEQRLERSST